MDATTSMAVARGRFDDDRRSQYGTRRPRRVPAHAGSPTRDRWTGRLGALAAVVAACALFASIPSMAGASAATDDQPRPTPAPAPLVDFGG